MPTYYNVNDAIIGERLYCTFEKCVGEGVVSSGSKDRGQYHSIKGNPAYAVIKKKLRRIK